MDDRNYLYRVLGFSAAPKVATFALTLVSYPLLVRSLGVADYGLFVYLTSLIALLELFAGFGVNHAAGRGLAECRAHHPGSLRFELRRWLSLQVMVCVVSALPMFGAGYAYLRLAGGPYVPLLLYALSFVALYFGVLVAFTRNALTSLLSFKSLAILDTVDSTVRSAGWIWVAMFHPTVTGLAIASLVNVAISMTLGGILIGRALGFSGTPASADESPARVLVISAMLRDSASYFALVVGTRAFNSLPVLLIGRLLGFEATGVLGAFAKVVEILSLPFTVIGNALMVRAPEIKRLGSEAVRRYWDMLFLLAVMAFVTVVGLFIVHRECARWLMPASERAPTLFILLPIWVFARSVSDLFAPASDYVGGLRRRIHFLGGFALAQLPLIWIGAHFGADMGAIGAMVFTYTFMIVGYVRIAHSVFFEGVPYRVPVEARLGSAIAAVTATAVFAMPLDALPRIMIYGIAVGAAFTVVPVLRRAFSPGRLIRLEFV